MLFLPGRFLASALFSAQSRRSIGFVVLAARLPGVREAPPLLRCPLVNVCADGAVFLCGNHRDVTYCGTSMLVDGRLRCHQLHNADHLHFSSAISWHLVVSLLDFLGTTRTRHRI
ncbi:hypothetical protein AGROH133_13287 [Agrobacterium tumefaciens]|nr:hypothetical protein AGROH133_13287 [Agrobacterium tumefaciens]